MKAGDLRHLVTIQRPVYQTDAKGNRRRTWADVATCWASMADVSGRDFYAAQAYHAQDIVTFGIRWREDVTTDCRILHRGQPYEIQQVNHLGYRRDFMHIKARMLRGDGD